MFVNGETYRVAGSGVAARYTTALIESLGGGVVRRDGAGDPNPALEWARSGAMALTGRAEGPPVLAPGPLAACARGAVGALRVLAGDGGLSDLDGAALLGERAAVFGLSRGGTTSPGGSCRLLRAADRFFAVNLARPDDVALLPAWLGEGDATDPWRFVAERAERASASEIVERARLLGLPAAVAVGPSPVAPPWCRVAIRGAPSSQRRDRPVVLDLSALWAGPLCTHLLSLAGARVVKVESTRRPDGARFGPHEFFDLLNAGKASVALDFRTSEGRATLRRIVERADIVVESSRPRALPQLGIDAESLVREVPGLTWVSITGYGRRHPGADWVAFGDDAGVAAGLAVATGSHPDSPLFCGDAIADPLAGLHAAVAAFASWRAGGGHLLDLSLCDVAAHVLAFGDAANEATVRSNGSGWEVAVGRERAPVLRPRARTAPGRARPLGADTDSVVKDRSLC
jgi:crotonobetainyl-CoA:carnitine CoA-transferase CaiB-like acyl-CoA transferase